MIRGGMLWLQTLLQIQVNLVDFFRQKQLDVGHMGIMQDTFQNLAGLAEITR